MMQSDGAAASSGCCRMSLPLPPVASQTDSTIAPIQAAECASTSTSVVAMLAQNAQEPEDRRGRGRVHEREEPARGRVWVDVHPLADHHPDLVPQAVILVRLAQKIDGQRNRREDDHQDQEERDEPTPEPARAGP